MHGLADQAASQEAGMQDKTEYQNKVYSRLAGSCY